MKNMLIATGRFSLTLICVSLLFTSAFAQIKLRRALDFDGDNKADYLVFNPTNSTWWVLKSRTLQSDNKYSGFNVSTQDILTPGDYDGDGKGDYCVWKKSNGTWYFYKSSDNTFNGVQFGLEDDEPVARDYDGDGKTDWAVVRRNHTSNTLVWWVLLSSTNNLIVYQFGLATDFIAPGDYDGDGKFDFAVQRPGALASDPSSFYISSYTFNGTNGYSLIYFGEGNETVVPGDYDGDNKTDIAVVRSISTSPNLIWHIRESTNGLTKTVYFGLTGSDITAQCDYDGDGKTDIAIWRKTDKSFYILRSSDNGLAIVQWGITGDHPIANYDTH